MKLWEITKHLPKLKLKYGRMKKLIAQ